MSNNISNSRKPTSRLAELAARIKHSAGIPGKIVEIPQNSFVCQSKSHGKIKTVISFGRDKEFHCDCGTIYKRV